MTTIAERDVALIDLLDRLLGGGVVIVGDITLAAANVDLVYVGLRALVSSRSLMGSLGTTWVRSRSPKPGTPSGGAACPITIRLNRVSSSFP